MSKPTGVQIEMSQNESPLNSYFFVQGHICIKLVFHFWFDTAVSLQTTLILSELSDDAIFSR